MLRIIIIILVLYLLWRVFKSLKITVSRKQPTVKKNNFNYIEDAEFEDITGKDEKE